jgi:hypothetical protein
MILLQPQQKLFKGYYCAKWHSSGRRSIFQTDNENLYFKHVVRHHKFLPIFPTKADLQKYKLQAQNQRWEK